MIYEYIDFLLCVVRELQSKKKFFLCLLFVVQRFHTQNPLFFEKLPIIESKRERGDPDGTQNEDFIKYT